MRKNFIKTLFAMSLVVATVGTTGLTAKAAETTAETATGTTTVQALKRDVIAKVFDAKYYAEAYPDVVAVLGNDEEVLLTHYINNGIKEGRDASATFNVSIYALANADLTEVYGDDLEAYIEHYVTFGVKENRIASNEQMAKLDKKTQVAIANSGTQMLSSKGVTAISFDSTYSSQAPSANLCYGDLVQININGDTARLGDSIYKGNGKYVTYVPTGGGGYRAEYSFKNIYLDAAMNKELAAQGDPNYIRWVAEHQDLYDENGEAILPPENASYNERGEDVNATNSARWQQPSYAPTSSEPEPSYEPESPAYEEITVGGDE